MALPIGPGEIDAGGRLKTGFIHHLDPQETHISDPRRDRYPSRDGARIYREHQRRGLRPDRGDDQPGALGLSSPETDDPGLHFHLLGSGTDGHGHLFGAGVSNDHRNFRSREPQ